nr:hypothetical protein [Tanacetum cinerariifolium]
GDVESARVILDSLEEFKLTSGLVPRGLPVKYLGVPLISSRLLNKDCKVLVEKAKNRIGGLPVKYLGVPLISSRLLNKDCKVLVEKAKNRIGDWKKKSLSFA